jgi:hypothetical protein
VDDIPFDLRAFRRIIYEDNSEGYDVLARVVPEAILAGCALKMAHPEGLDEKIKTANPSQVVLAGARQSKTT